MCACSAVLTEQHASRDRAVIGHPPSDTGHHAGPPEPSRVVWVQPAGVSLAPAALPEAGLAPRRCGCRWREVQGVKQAVSPIGGHSAGLPQLDGSKRNARAREQGDWYTCGRALQLSGSPAPVSRMPVSGSDQASNLAAMHSSSCLPSTVASVLVPQRRPLPP